jgi:hypothetical protein
MLQVQFLSIRYMVGRPVAAALLSLLAALHPSLEGPITSFVQVSVAAQLLVSGTETDHVRSRSVFSAVLESVHMLWTGQSRAQVHSRAGVQLPNQFWCTQLD